MADGPSTYGCDKNGKYTICAECGEKLYFKNGFNRINEDPLCKKCYRQRRSRKSVINYIEKSMVN